MTLYFVDAGMLKYAVLATSLEEALVKVQAHLDARWASGVFIVMHTINRIEKDGREVIC